MCGIAGYIDFGRSGLSVDAVVANMLQMTKYRGPDQTGIYKEPGLSMGMNRLNIIDREHHEIPYTDPQKQHVLVYNGEIYNHHDFRRGLSVSFQTVSDAESTLYDLAVHGMDNLVSYNGMYAFAYLDRRENKLYLVRDKAGEKPLYYIQNQDYFAFASEIKALVPLDSGKIRLPVSYKTYEFCVGRETLYENIRQVLPGEFLCLDLKKKKLSHHQYFNLWDHKIDLPTDLNQIESQLTELLEDSIRLRTKNLAHQFAIFTGGGVDSALMACIAKPDELYYCHYDLGKAFDELEYAQLVADRIGRKLKIIEPKKEDFERTRQKIAFHLDTPCTWTSFSLWMLLEQLPEHVKVIMTGEGADEAFAGYHRYHLLHHDEQIHSLQAMADYSYLIQKYYGSPVERYSKLVNRSVNPYDPEVNKFLHETVGHYFEKSDSDVVHGMGMHDFYTTMQVLLQMSDRMSMAFSVENRSPFLDYRLLQFAFSLESRFKIRDGVTKWILKKVASKFIPREIVDRIDKRGFSAPLNIWFGWDKLGKYNRSMYKESVFHDFETLSNDLKVKGFDFPVSDLDKEAS